LTIYYLLLTILFSQFPSMAYFVFLFNNQYSIVNNQFQSYPVRQSNFNRNNLPDYHRLIKLFPQKSAYQHKKTASRSRKWQWPDNYPQNKPENCKEEEKNFTPRPGQN